MKQSAPAQITIQEAPAPQDVEDHILHHYRNKTGGQWDLRASDRGRVALSFGCFSEMSFTCKRRGLLHNMGGGFQYEDPPMPLEATGVKKKRARSLEIPQPAVTKTP